MIFLTSTICNYLQSFALLCWLAENTSTIVRRLQPTKQCHHCRLLSDRCLLCLRHFHCLRLRLCLRQWVDPPVIVIPLVGPNPSLLRPPPPLLSARCQGVTLPGLRLALMSSGKATASGPPQRRKLAEAFPSLLGII